MNATKATALSQAAGALRKRIDRWRRTRKRIGPMPGTLWAAAIALAREHGALRVARAVRVDFGALKRRVEATGAEIRCQSSPAAFVEFPPFTSRDGEAVLDLSDDTGAKMTLRVAGRIELDVLALTNAFLGRPQR